MFLTSGNNIVVEMVNDQICALRRKMDVEFEKERGYSNGSSGFRGEGKQDVAACIEVFEKVLGG